MDCIYCAGKTSVTNSRPQKRLRQIWRRRKCKQCGSIFTTVEGADFTTTLLVRNTEGLLSPFRRDQLFTSILEACGHRPTRIADATGLTDTVIAHLRPYMASAQLDSDIIAKTAHKALERFDKPAAVHYKAFHPM